MSSKKNKCRMVGVKSTSNDAETVSPQMRRTIQAMSCIVAIASCFASQSLRGEPVQRHWSAAGGGRIADAASWDPQGTPGYDDTLELSTGTNSPARVESGDSIAVAGVRLGRGENDSGGRIEVSGGVLSITNLLALSGGPAAGNGQSVMNISGGRVTARTLVTGSCASSISESNSLNISGADTVFEVGEGEVKLSEFANAAGGARTHVIISDGATFRKESGGKTYIGYGTAVVDVDAGNVSLLCDETVVGCDSKGVGTINLLDGVWSAGTTILGQNRGRGVIDASGGTMTFSSTGWAGGLVLGWNNSSGTMRVGGTAGVTVTGSVNVGYEARSSGVLEISGGSFNVENENVTIGNKTTSSGEVSVSGGTFGCNDLRIGSSGTGIAEVSGGTLTVRGAVNIGYEASGTGTLKVSGGTVNANSLTVGRSGAALLEVSSGEINCPAGDIYVGYNSAGAITINGGTVSCAYWVDFNRNKSAVEESVINLNGGVLKVGQINNAGSAKATFNWNGGTLKSNGNGAYWNMYDIFNDDTADMIDVNVLPGGAVIDTDLQGVQIHAVLSGSGNIVKRGANHCKVMYEARLKRGIVVEEGKLTFANGLSSGADASNPMKEISVSAGATLDLNKDEVYVQAYTLSGIPQAAGEYSAHNGTIHVVPPGSVVTALWTNETGDGKATTPANWECRDADGVIVWDALPTDATAVTVPYSAAMPDQAEFSRASLVMAVSGTAAPRGDWAVPAVVRDAMVWYDYSDESTIRHNLDGNVSGVANKGVRGSALDSVVYGTSGQSFPDDTESVNGRGVMTFAWSKGFVSVSAPGLLSDNARTLISVGRRNVPQDGESTLFSIGFARNSDDSMKGMFRISRNNNEQEFRYCDSTISQSDSWWSAKVSPGADPTDLAISYMDFDGERTVRAWVYSPSVGETARQSAMIATGGSLDADGSELLYMGYRRQSVRASTGVLAEQLVFNRRLTDEELSAVSDYLRAKWFVEPEVDPADLPNSIAFVGENAVYNLGGGSWVFDDIAGSGTISNANATVNGTIEVFVADDGTIDPLLIDGSLTIGENARLIVRNTAGLKVPGVFSVCVIASGGVYGTFASVEADTPRVKMKAQQTDTTVSVAWVKRGLAMIVR